MHLCAPETRFKGTSNFSFSLLFGCFRRVESYCLFLCTAKLEGLSMVLLSKSPQSQFIVLTKRIMCVAHPLLGGDVFLVCPLPSFVLYVIICGFTQYRAWGFTLLSISASSRVVAHLSTQSIGGFWASEDGVCSCGCPPWPEGRWAACEEEVFAP